MMRRLANKDRRFTFCADRFRSTKLRVHLWTEHQRGAAYWPFKSAKQRRYVHAVAGGTVRKKGMSKKTARRLIRHSKGRK